MPRHRRKERNSQSRQLVGSCLFFKACTTSHIKRKAAAFRPSWEISSTGTRESSRTNTGQGQEGTGTAGTPPPPPSKGLIGGATAGQGNLLYTQGRKGKQGGRPETGPGKATRHQGSSLPFHGEIKLSFSPTHAIISRRKGAF